MNRSPKYRNSYGMFFCSVGQLLQIERPCHAHRSAQYPYNVCVFSDIYLLLFLFWIFAFWFLSNFKTIFNAGLASERNLGRRKSAKSVIEASVGESEKSIYLTVDFPPCPIAPPLNKSPLFRGSAANKVYESLVYMFA